MPWYVVDPSSNHLISPQTVALTLNISSYTAKYLRTCEPVALRVETATRGKLRNVLHRSSLRSCKPSRPGPGAKPKGQLFAFQIKYWADCLESYRLSWALDFFQSAVAKFPVGLHWRRLEYFCRGDQTWILSSPASVAPGIVSATKTIGLFPKKGRLMATSKSPTTSTAGRAKIAKVMEEFKTGTVHSAGTGKTVKNRKQAVAIALNEARH